MLLTPGKNGGIAWEEDGEVYAERMPDGMTAIVDKLRELAASSKDPKAVVEKVGGYMPGNSGPAAATFARHCGNIEAALYCLGIGSRQVAPNKWQKELGTWPKDKKERKNAIKDEMQRRYPHLSVTLCTADALALLEWEKMQ